MISRRSPIVDQIRRFDRFYEAILRNAVHAEATEDFSIVDVRIVGEIDWSGGASGVWLSHRLGLNQSTTCRALKKLEAYGFVSQGASGTDARMRTWDLTEHGRKLADDIEGEYRQRVIQLLLDVPPSDHKRLSKALRVVELTLHQAWLRARSG